MGLMTVKQPSLTADNNHMADSPMHSARTITDDKGLSAPKYKVASRKERRLRSRVRCEGLQCTLGQVIGLSGTGLRISARGWCRVRQDDRVKLALRHAGSSLSLSARIAWVKKTGVFKYEAGAEFLNLTPEQTRELGQMAQIAMPKMTIRRGTLPDLPTD